MKFIIDAQLPKSLATWLNTQGHDAEHTLDLPLGNHTPDHAISSIADKEQAIVVTKDSDFLNSHLLRSRPARLLIVSTGNISNRRLLNLFQSHIDLIVSSLGQSNLVEVTQEGLILHDS